MRTIIAGSRTANNYQALVDALAAAPFTPTVVISGMARGADRLGELYAFSQGLPLEKFPADWDKHGKNAGYVRNIAMAEVAECLITLWDSKSRGTKHMIDVAKHHGLKIYVKELL